MDRALQLLWGLQGLRLLLLALSEDRGVFVFSSVIFTVIFLLIMGAAIRRGERLARLLIGGGALVGAVFQVFALEELDLASQVFLGWPCLLASAAIGFLLLDGRAMGFYLREQQLHTRYRRQRRQASLTRASAA
jgi:hypothetical protein